MIFIITAMNIIITIMIIIIITLMIITIAIVINRYHGYNNHFHDNYVGSESFLDSVVIVLDSILAVNPHAK